jgi:hypothetical protein
LFNGSLIGFGAAAGLAAALGAAPFVLFVVLAMDEFRVFE